MRKLVAAVLIGIITTTLASIRNDVSANEIVEPEVVSENQLQDAIDAEQGINRIVVYADDFLDKDSLKEEVNQLLNQEDIDAVSIVSKTLKENVAQSASNWRRIGIDKQIRFEGVSHYTYEETLNTSSGAPGIKIDLASSKEVPVPVELTETAGIAPVMISSIVGFSTKSKYPISYVGSYTIPDTYKDQEIKRVRLHATAVYANYRFVTRESGSLTVRFVKKPVGMDYQKFYEYI